MGRASPMRFTEPPIRTAAKSVAAAPGRRRPQLLIGDECAIQRAVLGPVGHFRDVRDHAGEDLLRGLGIGEEMRDHGFGGHGLFLNLPAVVIGDHGHRRDGDLGFARQLHFTEIRHAHDIEAELPMHFALGTRAELRSVHVHIRAATMDDVAECFAVLVQQSLERRGNGIGKGDVRRDPIAKKSVTMARAIEELRRQHDVPRRVLLLQRAHRRDAHDPPHPERPQRPDVRAMIQLMRQDAMPAPVPGQKVHLPPRERPADEHVGRRPERRLDDVFLHVREPLHLVQTAPSDDADGWCLHGRRDRRRARPRATETLLTPAAARR